MREAAGSATPISTLTDDAFVVAILLLGLVAVERIGAQPHPEREIDGLFRGHGPARQVGDDRHLVGALRNLAHGGATELDDVLRFQFRRLAAADDDETCCGKATRRQKFEGCPILAFEMIGLCGFLHLVDGASERASRGRAEPEGVVTKHDQDTGPGCGNG